MKKIVKKIINNFGFNITKLNKETNIINFDELLKKKIPENPTIFDVGGNSGQSIDKFLGMFNNPIIHSFEPIKKEFDK